MVLIHIFLDKSDLLDGVACFSKNYHSSKTQQFCH